MATPRGDRGVLPTTVKPSHYHVSIFDIEMGGKFSYKGTTTVTAVVTTATKEITFNSHELKLLTAVVQAENAKTQSSIEAASVSYDEPSQRATLAFDGDLPVGNVSIIITFEGTIGNAMAGFYRSKYTPVETPVSSVAMDGDQHVMFSTQFESSDARRAFPCWDEPNLKATFDVELELPNDQVALSNMPEKQSRSSKKSGYKIVSFERTPIMSTYLLAWAIGDFQYVEEFTTRQYNGKHLPVRVYTTRGLKEQGRYALEHAHQIVDLFSEVFGIDYPLPKADLLAVHEFSHGAMENWGLVTYRTTAVLYDEKSSDVKFKNRVAYVVAHELAHQWFGNLVTMDWWSELWLNEGFATWAGWFAIDRLHPDWKVWPQFVAEEMQQALGLDALRSSHPIEVPVRNALEVDQIFDAISYRKGCAIISMLANHLGVEVFLKGVMEYLKLHAYGNATTTALWAALSKASGQDVIALMDPWVRRIGYPVLTVVEEPGQILLSQSRFLSTGDANGDEDTTTWWIPLGLADRKDETHSTALTQKEDVIRDINDDFYKLNSDNSGFYRTNYPPQRLIKLSKQIDRLSLSDKIGLVGDAGALAVSGHATTPALLGFVEGFQNEDNYLVWAQVLGSLGTVKSVFSEDVEISDALRRFVLKLVADAVKKISWNQAPGEDYLMTRLRPLLIETAGLNGDAETITEAKRRFSSFTSGDEAAISPSLRTAVFSIAIKSGGQHEYEAIKAFWKTTTSIDGKELAVRAMGRISDIALLPDFLDFLFHTIPVQDCHTGAASLAANPITRDGLWDFIRQNFDDGVGLKTKLGRNMVVLDRFIQVSLNKFSTEEREREIAAFFEGRDNKGYDRTLGIVSDTIKERAQYRARDKNVLLEWLQVHEYV